MLHVFLRIRKHSRRSSTNPFSTTACVCFVTLTTFREWFVKDIDIDDKDRPIKMREMKNVTSKRGKSKGKA